MYCSTCGDKIPAGRGDCAACGAAVTAGRGGSELSRPATQAAHPAAASHTHVCRRCGYTGEGLSYFSHGPHIAGLVVLGFLGAMTGILGIVALVYYFSNRDNRICPRCGKNWGKQPGTLPAAQAGLAPAASHSARLPAGGGATRGWSVALFVLAALLVVIGVGAGELFPFLLGTGAAAGGVVLHHAARRQREARREAILSSLQLPVLRLAAERQGRLTVTEVAAALGWTLPRAEKVLGSLDDGLRVSSEVTDEGVIVYEFREIAHGPRRLSGPAA